jgi:hypothetical protein
MSNKGLCLDTPDSGKATIEQVMAHVNPTRLTQTYQPIQNAELLEMLEKVANEYGLTLQNPEFGLARHGQRMFGVYEVKGLDHFNNRVQLMVGVRNAFDGCMSAGICFGSRVFVCSNLIFTGYAEDDNIMGKVTHKHTTNIRATLRDRLIGSLEQVKTFRNFQNRFYTLLEKTKLSPADGCEIIIKAGFDGVIGKKDVLEYADEWFFQETGPRNEFDEAEREYHKEFKPRNAWSLMNAFTQLQKKRHERNPVATNKESIQLTRFMHKMFPLK